MRATRSAIAALHLLLGSICVIACAARGSTDGAELLDDDDASASADVGARDARAQDASTQDASARHDATIAADANTNDAPSEADAPTGTSTDAAIDASVDAIADATDPDDGAIAPPGAACAPAGAVQSRACGICGTQRRICASGDGGARWLDWGACFGERAGGGLPNTTVTVSCALCGSQTITYDSQCAPDFGPCLPAPGAECDDGMTQYTLGFPCATTAGRMRTCDASCHWGSYSACMSPGTNVLTIATTTAAGANRVRASFPYVKTPAISGLLRYNRSCPFALWSPPPLASPRAYVEVRNPTSQTAIVSLWHSDGDTQMAAYAGSIPPSEPDRGQCIPGTEANVRCPNALQSDCSGPYQGSSVAGIANVTIPPASSIIVYNQQDSGSEIAFELNVRTESLQ